MEIDSYRPPNILFLLGCFVDECHTVEDLFDERVLNASTTPDNILNVQLIDYDKIPKKFTGVEEWPKTTNLKCWLCDFNFYSIPIFIPLRMYYVGKDIHMDTRGNYCSWNCAISDIDNGFTRGKWERCKMLKILCKIMTGSAVDDIAPMIARTNMIQYGGNMTSAEYKTHLKSISNKYDNIVTSNLISSISK